MKRAFWTDCRERFNLAASSASGIVPSARISFTDHRLNLPRGLNAGSPKAIRCCRTSGRLLRVLPATSRSGCVPKSFISFDVHRRGTVGRRMRLRIRSATTSLMVRPVRRASTESGSRPSCRISAALHGASFFIRGPAKFHRRLPTRLSYQHYSNRQQNVKEERSTQANAVRRDVADTVLVSMR